MDVEPHRAEIQNGYCLPIASGAIQLGWLETRGS
jgi:hypothetical protein